MASPKRTTKQREYDLQEISSLYLQGWIQAAIADHLAKTRPYRISQQTISRDLKTIQDRWLASSVRDFDEARAQELAKIDHLELTYWGLFEGSKKPDIKKRISKRVDDGGKKGSKDDWRTTEVTQEAIIANGDWRILQRVEWCIDRRCKLLGLDAPTKNELTGKAGGPIETIDMSTLTDNQLKRLAAGEAMASVLSDDSRS